MGQRRLAAHTRARPGAPRGWWRALEIDVTKAESVAVERGAARACRVLRDPQRQGGTQGCMHPGRLRDEVRSYRAQAAGQRRGETGGRERMPGYKNPVVQGRTLHPCAAFARILQA